MNLCQQKIHTNFQRIYIPLPDVDVRFELLKERLVNIANSLTDSELRELAVRTERYSCSDIDVLCRSALMEPGKNVTSLV